MCPLVLKCQNSHILIRGIWRRMKRRQPSATSRSTQTTNVSTNTTTIFCLMFYALVGFMANEEKPQTEILLCVLLSPLNGVHWLKLAMPSCPNLESNLIIGNLKGLHARKKKKSKTAKNSRLKISLAWNTRGNVIKYLLVFTWDNVHEFQRQV